MHGSSSALCLFAITILSFFCFLFIELCTTTRYFSRTIASYRPVLSMNKKTITAICWLIVRKMQCPNSFCSWESHFAIHGCGSARLRWQTKLIRVERGMTRSRTPLFTFFYLPPSRGRCCYVIVSFSGFSSCYVIILLASDCTRCWVSRLRSSSRPWYDLHLLRATLEMFLFKNLKIFSI